MINTSIIIYLDEFPYTLPLEATVQLILELHSWIACLPTPQRAPIHDDAHQWRASKTKAIDQLL